MRTSIRTYGPQWHKARATYLGASEVAAICGLDPWRDAEDVYQSKQNPDREKLETGPNTPIWWGHKDEPAIVEAGVYEVYPSSQPWQVRTGLSWLDDQYRLMASPDAVFMHENRSHENILGGTTEVIEAKSVNRAASHWSDGAPIHVQIQGHSQMAVLGPRCVKAHLAARINGRPVQVWTIDRDEMLCDALKTITKTWWEQYVEMGPTRWSSYAACTLADSGFSHAVPTSRNNVTAVANDEQLVLFQEWSRAKAEHRRWESEKKSLAADITDALGKADTLIDMQGTPLVRRSWVHQSKFDSKALCVDHPELENLYSSPIKYQRLTEAKKNIEE